MRRPRGARGDGLRIVVMNTGDLTLEITSLSAIRRYLVSLLKLVPLSVLRYIVNNDHLIEFYVSLYNEIDVRAAIQEARPALRRIHSGSQLKRPPSGAQISPACAIPHVQVPCTTTHGALRTVRIIESRCFFIGAAAPCRIAACATGKDPAALARSRTRCRAPSLSSQHGPR